jgi:hypothetical protein
MPVDKYPWGYARALLKFLPAAKPSEPTEPSKPSRGRPKALSKQPLSQFLQQGGTKNRHFGQLLKAIAEINSKNKKLTSSLSIARELGKRPEYSRLSERQLRRDVREAIEWEIRFLKEIRPDCWVEILGIMPPPAMTDEFLREKALEFLRHYLAQQLLAKKP